MIPHTGSQESSTPEKSRNEDRKRKRDVLSCLECRRRKLKCSRDFPACNRCVKGGNASSCTYKSFHGATTNDHQDEPDASAEEDSRVEKRPRGLCNLDTSNARVSTGVEVSGNFIQPTPGSIAQENAIKRLENRLASLEALLTQSSTAGKPRNEERPLDQTMRSTAREGVPNQLETLLFKGGGVRTQFYGASNPTSLLAHVSSSSTPRSWLTNSSFQKFGHS